MAEQKYDFVPLHNSQLLGRTTVHNLTMIDNTWKLWLPMTAVHSSKQNSTFVAEFNSNLKIPRGGWSPPPLPLPLLRTWRLSWIESTFHMYRIDFDDASKRLQFLSNLPVSKRLCIETTVNSQKAWPWLIQSLPLFLSQTSCLIENLLYDFDLILPFLDLILETINVPLQRKYPGHQVVNAFVGWLHCFFFLLSEVFLQIMRVFPSRQKPKLLCWDLV